MQAQLRSSMLACEQQQPLTMLTVKTIFIGQFEFSLLPSVLLFQFILACLRLSVSLKVLVLALLEHVYKCMQF